ncbi:MAG: hypothetical protein EAZ97_16555 [Bacteroidetes bacterium]|nr:MAG: hypothetical protein EAZ97_16555 [Bacteroidota bacterium]
MLNFKKIFASASLIAFCSVNLFAQAGWKWPEDAALKTTAIEKNTLYADAVKAKEYEKAIEPLEWLLKTCPDLNKSLYQNGETIYKELEKVEKDPTKKMMYQDKVLKMFYDRFKLYGEEEFILTKLGNVSYNFLINRKEQNPAVIQSLDSLYSRIFEVMKGNTSSVHLTFMMSVACLKKAAGQFKDEDILKRYDAISEVIEANIAKEQEVEKWKQAQDGIDKTLTRCVTIDCKFVLDNLGPKLDKNPSDLKLAKQILKYMMNGKCTKEPLFLRTAEAMFASEPSYGLGQTIAGMHLEAGNDEKALGYCEKAITLAKEDSLKSDTYMIMAKIVYKKKQFGQARDYALKAVAAHKETDYEAYSFIGAMYMQSGGMCVGKNPVENRVAYLAAYEMYARAGNSSGMANAQGQFPSMEEIFTHTPEKKLGESISVGCWIGGSATLRKR